MLDALSETIMSVNRMSLGGIRTEITSSKYRNVDDIVEKYGKRDDRLPVQKWIHVSFYPISQREKDFIFKEKMRLSGFGICFDTGAGRACNLCKKDLLSCDWELDWSFHIDQKVESNIDNCTEGNVGKLEDVNKQEILVSDILKKINKNKT